MKKEKSIRSVFHNAGSFAVFVGPGLFFFVMTIIVPLCYGFYLTFTDWNGIAKTKEFVGIKNYLTAFQDIKFWGAIGLTLIFTLVSVILVNYVAFHLARLVTSGINGAKFFSRCFFIPESNRRSSSWLYLAVYF